MSGYVSKVQIGEDLALVGSTLYGICGTAANEPQKTVVPGQYDVGNNYLNTNYNQLMSGTTIHIKFLNGNTADTNLTLQVGTLSTAQNIVGKCTCPANTIISFTLDENQNWVVNDNVDTNTEYVFAGNTPYNASTNKALAESSVSAAAHKGVITDIANNSASADLPTTAAVVNYVSHITSGLTAPMQFQGVVTAIPPTTGTYNLGDVVLLSGTSKEYVFDGTNWIELGDEGSYALKSSTDTITEVASLDTVSLGSASGWDAGTQASLSIQANTNTAASLTENQVQIPNVTNAGSATTASVAAGILNITLGSAPTIAATPITVKEIGTFTPNVPVGINFTTNTLPQLTVTDTTASRITTNNTEVVVPNNSNNTNP